MTGIKRNAYINALHALADQEDWIKEHGGDESGYVARYGSADGNHYGNGGEAIYRSDMRRLQRLMLATQPKEM